jgi:hypothetical protein
MNNNIGTLDLSGTLIGRYRASITVDSYSLNAVLTMTDSLKIKTAGYSVSQSAKFPEHLEKTITHPNKIGEVKNAQDDHYLHIGVSVEFAKTGASTTHPSHVYLTVKKAGA